MRNLLKKSFLLVGFLGLLGACNSVEIPAEQLQARAVEVQTEQVNQPVSAGVRGDAIQVRKALENLRAKRVDLASANLPKGEAVASSKHGQEIYEASCASCHGYKGNPAPSLEEAALRMDFQVFDTTVTHGRAGMPAHPQLTKMQKESLWSFIESSPAGTALAKNQEGSGCGCGGACGGGAAKAEGGGCGGGCGQKAAGQGCGGSCGQKAADQGCGGGCGQRAQAHAVHAH